MKFSFPFLSNSHIGIAMYADGMREDSMQVPGIVGFQSFVQRSDHPQKFNISEEPHLERRKRRYQYHSTASFKCPTDYAGNTVSCGAANMQCGT
ncbi:hypothetical protein BDU57DRAFT_56153 [Ampelomyces quisqualis]|uniref:Uncharacterized protein n=1 Tax=Ampelomyces quisqualis TaxID=50730 RepID=A0A6A5R6X2_AMPQU|nr:hypothetical protein BDU57DRAFT_56153 [Ampelomyces quisqualis]